MYWTFMFVQTSTEKKCMLDQISLLKPLVMWEIFSNSVHKEYYASIYKTAALIVRSFWWEQMPSNISWETLSWFPIEEMFPWEFYPTDI